MDQVPIYFETEPKSTITTEGSCEVLMHKGGTSRKRFTVVFAITADGVTLRPHILFCGLKNNKPAVFMDILVDVKKIGMWNDDILLDFTKNAILSQQETAFYCDPVLYVRDSYGVHLNLAKSKILEKYNVFVAIVPPNMTKILQPLDFAINHGYQAYCQTCYDGYIAQALEDTCLQTKAANPKVPSYMAVSSWTLDWIKSMTQECIRNSFTIKGVVPKCDFELAKLHPPLKALFEAKYCSESWDALFGELLSSDFELEVGILEAPEWFLPDNGSSTLFECLNQKLYGSSNSWKQYQDQVVAYMKQDANIQDITDSAYFDSLLNNDCSGSELEIYSASSLYKWSIEVHDIYNAVEYPTINVVLAKSGDYYAIKILGN